jgi:NitT/TauT family transport system ATP-binding protein
MMTDLHLLELRRVYQIYGSEPARFVALEDVSLAVAEGEFVTLLGPSGCGKSTLLRIATGLQKPTKGQVLYRGRPLEGVNPRATIVFQTFALFPWLTVLENVAVALRARGVPPEIRATRAIDFLDRVGLDGFESAYPRELSGGMRQKVGFARAMALEPELLCLDEPFSALDVMSAESLRGELMELWMAGSLSTRAVLLVTHNIEEAVFMADRILVMEKSPGRLVADIRVSLPHPRHRKSVEFLEIVDKVYATLAGQTEPETVELGTAPGEPGRTRSLPHVHIGDLAGFLEHLAEMPGGRADIYRLAEALKLDSDHLLRLVEASELLSLVTVAEGDATLTPLGESFAEATIQTRKEVFATRIRRLPFFRWLSLLLAAAEGKKLEWDVIQAALGLEFPPEEAEKQLDTAVNWGRYAEILSYDDDTGVIYLESRADVHAEAASPA